jgi:hypothetical protein
MFAIVNEVAPRKLQQVPPQSLIVPRTYIVQVSSLSTLKPEDSRPTVSQPEAAAAAAHPPSAVLQDAKAAHLDVREISSFDSDIFRGVVVEAANDEAAAALLQHLNDDGRVASIFPVVSECLRSLIEQQHSSCTL